MCASSTQQPLLPLPQLLRWQIGGSKLMMRIWSRGISMSWATPKPIIALNIWGWVKKNQQ